MSEELPPPRRRSRIQELLEQSRKKRQLLKDSEDFHRQLRDVTSGLTPGQKVYVRYEFDDILETEDESEPPKILEARIVWWPAKLSIYEPQRHLRKPTQVVVPKVDDSDIEKVVPDVCDTPAVPSCLTGAEKEERQYTAAEVFAEIKDELSTSDRENMVEVLKTHGDKVVYTLDYEGRDAFSPESIPCFFVDEENLMHLHKCWGGAVYRTEQNIGEVNLEERVEDGITAVAELFGDEEEGMPTVLNEVAEKVVSMLTNFYHHADEVGSRNMTADDVCEYFAKLPEMTVVWLKHDDWTPPESGDELQPPTAAVVSNDTPATPASPQLEDKPFPRA